jgi:hypothetical protein
MAREKRIHLQAPLTMPDNPILDEAKAHIENDRDGNPEIEISLGWIGEEDFSFSLKTDQDLEWAYYYADQLEQFFGSIKFDLFYIAAERAEKRGIDSRSLMPNAPYRGVLRKRND